MITNKEQYNEVTASLPGGQSLYRRNSWFSPIDFNANKTHCPVAQRKLIRILVLQGKKKKVEKVQAILDLLGTTLELAPEMFKSVFGAPSVYKVTNPTPKSCE